MTPNADLPQAIADFKAALPGWWFTLTECHESCIASCAPTSESPHITLVKSGNAFDSGFDVDLPQPSTLAVALRDVQWHALLALRDEGTP